MSEKTNKPSVIQVNGSNQYILNTQNSDYQVTQINGSNQHIEYVLPHPYDNSVQTILDNMSKDNDCSDLIKVLQGVQEANGEPGKEYSYFHDCRLPSSKLHQKRLERLLILDLVQEKALPGNKPKIIIVTNLGRRILKAIEETAVDEADSCRQ